jgi:hypothetical protein
MKQIAYLPIRLRTDEIGNPEYTMEEIMESLSNGTATIKKGNMGAMFIEDTSNTNKIMGVVDGRDYIDNQIIVLAARMLELASDTFRNHGCNDLDEYVSNGLYNEKAICDMVRVYNGDDTSDWPSQVNRIGDASLMDFLAYRLRTISDNQIGK